MGSFLEILENLGSHFQEISSSKKEPLLYRYIINILFNNKIIGILEGLSFLGEDWYTKKKRERESFSNFPRMTFIWCYLLEDKGVAFLENISKTFQDFKKLSRGIKWS